MSVTDLVAAVSLDAYLLSNAAHQVANESDGRAWERAAAGLFRRPGLSRRQMAGGTKLFGRAASSKAAHELDAAAAGLSDILILEAKNVAGGVVKSEAAHFHQKTFDFFCSDLGKNSDSSWWRFLVSTSPVTNTVRLFCAHLGLMLCEPSRLPLPYLLRISSRCSADLLLPPVLAREAVRLFEPVVAPIQKRWRYNRESRFLEHRPLSMMGIDLEDMIYVQEELSVAVLDLYDRYRPLFLARRTAQVLGRAQSLAA